MSNVNINISFIIPHYNTPDLLSVLLKSIPVRKDYQVIVVDDNSTQDVGLLKLVIKEDGRCEFYKNDSGIQSAGACRNLGLDKAKGKWVLFADADDHFQNDFEYIVEKYLNNEEDIIYFSPISKYINVENIATRHFAYERLVNDYYLAATPKSECKLRYCYVVPWSKMIRKSFIDRNDVRFDETISANDVMFSLRAAYFANKITICLDTIYTVTVREGSLTKVKTELDFDARTDVYVRSYTFLNDVLDSKSFSMLNMDIEAGRQVLRAIAYFGIRKAINVFNIMKRNEIRIATWKLLNPMLILRRLRYILEEYTYKKDSKN